MSDVNGNLFVVAAPSGAGKTSLVNALVEADDRISLSVSHTTRPARPGETDGQDYYFVDPHQFDSMVATDGFLEHANVFDRHYGTAREPVELQLASGQDMVLEIDWQGARQVRAAWPRAIGIFILPPSRATLESRLNKRGQDSADIIAGRMAKARSELSHYNEFDYLVVNDRFDQALAEMQAIVTAARMRSPQQSKRHAALLKTLLA